MAQRHNAPRHIVRRRQALVRVPLLGDLHQLFVPRISRSAGVSVTPARIAFDVTSYSPDAARVAAES
jgi:hypothetical protein